MPTSGNDSGNKLALRASLKKEDESLGERLAATDVPLPVPPGEDLAAAAASVAQAPLTPLAQTVSAKPAGKRPPAAGKAASKIEAKTMAAGKTANKPGGKPAADNAPPATRKAAPAKAAKGAAGPAQPGGQAVGQGRAPKATGSKPTAAGKKAGKLEGAVEKTGKAVKEKRDKRVRLAFDLLKSEEAAIEAVRAELAKVAGWAASQSDILRAGVRLFAEQKLEQMKEVLDGLSKLAARKGKKRG